MMYPSDVALSYGYDTYGAVSSINATIAGATLPVVCNLLCQPATRVPYSWRHANGEGVGQHLGELQLGEVAAIATVNSGAALR